MGEDIIIVWGQDLAHCDEHCYEDAGVEKWRCMDRDHVSHEDCSEDFLHCKICFAVIENPTGNNNFCRKHQNQRKLLDHSPKD